MKYGFLVCSLLLTIALQPRAFADQDKAPGTSHLAVQDPGRAKPGEAPGKVGPAPYLLAGDDVLAITVINFTNLTTQVVIPPDGNISVPLLEPLSVTGKTTAEVAQLLTEKWRKYVVNPVVTVALMQRRKENVLIYGFVPRAGTVDFRAPMHVLEAVAEVGGAAPTGDLSRATLTRKSGEKLTMDLSHPETKGGSQSDILLQAGDVIYVPEKRTQVNVLGEVNRPGSLDYREDMTILDAIGASGGVTDNADLANATLIHEGVEKRLDMESLLRKGDIKLNIKMAAGDRILIPEIRNRTYVFGAVARPGYYTYKPGDRVLDALNGTGGPIQQANLAKINVIHIDRAKNTAHVDIVDIDKFLKKGDLKGNMSLQPGDVVFIPDKKQTIGAGGILGILSGVNLITSTMRILGLP